MILSSFVLALTLNFNNQLVSFAVIQGYSFFLYITIEIFRTFGLIGVGIFIRKERKLLSNISNEKLFALEWILTGIAYIILSFLGHYLILCILLLTFDARGDGFSNIMQRLVLGDTILRQFIESIFALRILIGDIFKSIVAVMLGYCMQNFGMELSVFGLGLLAFLIMSYIFAFGISQE